MQNEDPIVKSFTIEEIWRLILSHFSFEEQSDYGNVRLLNKFLKNMVDQLYKLQLVDNYERQLQQDAVNPLGIVIRQDRITPMGIFKKIPMLRKINKNITVSDLLGEISDVEAIDKADISRINYTINQLQYLIENKFLTADNMKEIIRGEFCYGRDSSKIKIQTNEEFEKYIKLLGKILYIQNGQGVGFDMDFINTFAVCYLTLDKGRDADFLHDTFKHLIILWCECAKMKVLPQKFQSIVTDFNYLLGNWSKVFNALKFFHEKGIIIEQVLWDNMHYRLSSIMRIYDAFLCHERLGVPDTDFVRLCRDLFQRAYKKTDNNNILMITGIQNIAEIFEIFCNLQAKQLIPDITTLQLYTIIMQQVTCFYADFSRQNDTQIREEFAWEDSGRQCYIKPIAQNKKTILFFFRMLELLSKHGELVQYVTLNENYFYSDAPNNTFKIKGVLPTEQQLFDDDIEKKCLLVYILSHLMEDAAVLKKGHEVFQKLGMRKLEMVYYVFNMAKHLLSSKKSINTFYAKSLERDFTELLVSIERSESSQILPEIKKMLVSENDKDELCVQILLAGINEIPFVRLCDFLKDSLTSFVMSNDCRKILHMQCTKFILHKKCGFDDFMKLIVNLYRNNFTVGEQILAAIADSFNGLNENLVSDFTDAIIKLFGAGWLPYHLSIDMLLQKIQQDASSFNNWIEKLLEIKAITINNPNITMPVTEAELLQLVCNNDANDAVTFIRELLGFYSMRQAIESLLAISFENRLADAKKIVSCMKDLSDNELLSPAYFSYNTLAHIYAKSGIEKLQILVKGTVKLVDPIKKGTLSCGALIVLLNKNNVNFALLCDSLVQTDQGQLSRVMREVSNEGNVSVANNINASVFLRVKKPVKEPLKREFIANHRYRLSLS